MMSAHVPAFRGVTARMAASSAAMTLETHNGIAHSEACHGCAHSALR